MRIFYILSFIVSLSFSGFSQGNVLPAAEVKILKFYPNPAVSQITFSFEQLAEKDYSFQIFNFIGKKVYEAQTLAPKTVVNITDFFRGVYIFQLRDKTGRIVESGKFQVIR